MRRVKKGKSLKDNREIPNITICRDRFPISVANDKFAIFGYSFYLDTDFYIFRAIKC